VDFCAGFARFEFPGLPGLGFGGFSSFGLLAFFLRVNASKLV